MQIPVPFEGFEGLAPEYAAVVLVGTVLLLALLYSLRLPVTQKTALAFVPWMITGAALHVLYQLNRLSEPALYPELFDPLLSAPTVYLTTFLGLGIVWVVAAFIGVNKRSTTERKDVTARYLGLIGIVVALAVTGVLVWRALDPAVSTNITATERFIPVVGLVASLLLTGIVYILIGTWRTYVIAEARYVGAVALFAHLFDGITTTIGVDILGVGERSALPARIIDFAASLPTAEYIGSGWLFLVVKLLIAVGIVVAFADFVREEPTRGNLLFAFITAVGLGPAMNNFLLFVLGAY